MDEADATMFGGTKGKFNGLAYLQAGEEEIDARRRQRRATRRQDTRSSAKSYNDGDSLYGSKTSKNWWGPVTPPDDVPNPVNGDARRRRSNNKRTRDDWTSNTVSSWFDDTESDDYEGDETDSPPVRQPRRSDASPLFGAIDAFLGLNRKNLQERADWYDSQMGIERREKKRRPRSRPGYAYPLDDPEFAVDGRLDDGVVDVEPIPVQVPLEAQQRATLSNEDEVSPEKVLSWQERALAIERVPPAGIAAWGPSGELEMDARTKSILDALEDIMNAKRRVSDQAKLVDLAKEEIAILRVNAQLNEKRMARTRKNIKTIQRDIRILGADIQEASRKLRLSKSRLKRMKEDLAEIEARHWAVLSFYNPESVAANLADAFRELEESEPAVKLYKETIDSSDAVSSPPEINNEL